MCIGSGVAGIELGEDIGVQSNVLELVGLLGAGVSASDRSS